MARKRDIVEEILGKRRRLGRKRDPASLVYSRAMSLFVALRQIERLPKAESALKREMIRYFSVGLVSCLEGYFRLTLQYLVDQGSPYRENAARLEDPRLDLSTITRMHMQRVSVGELISHMVPLSSLDDINRHMTVLLGVEYFKAVKPMAIWKETTFEEQYPRAWETLTGLFQDRHIACHELHPTNKWTFARATEQWRLTIHLVEATEILLDSLGVRPRSNFQGIVKAARAAAK